MIDTHITVPGLALRARQLTQLIDEETDRLARERPANLADLVANKQLLANEFNHAVQSLLANRDQIRMASPEDRQDLLETLATFDASVLRNGALLLKLQRHQQDLLDMIAEEVHPGSRRPTSYAPATGTKAPSGRAPLAINAVI